MKIKPKWRVTSVVMRVNIYLATYRTLFNLSPGMYIRLNALTSYYELSLILDFMKNEQVTIY